MVSWSKHLEFTWALYWGYFLSLPVVPDSLGWFMVHPCFSTLRCLAAGGVTLVLCREHVGLPLWGCRCFWVPRSWGVIGLSDGVTCLRSGLWSSSVHDRNEDFPSFCGGWVPALRAGSPTSGWRCVLRPALVQVAVPPSPRLVLCIRTGFLLSGPGVCVGFNRFLLLCIPSGCGHPLGQ